MRLLVWLLVPAMAAGFGVDRRWGRGRHLETLTSRRLQKTPVDDSWRRKAPDLFESSVKLPTIDRRRKPEVMAPAGGWPQLRAAVFNGADAVYLGLSSFSARARASNFDPGEELDAVVDFCRMHEVKVYVALNTLVFDEEMDEVAALIARCNEAGVDAVIVQDLGVQRLVRELSPELPIHASTQQSISSADGAEFSRSLGASRVVVGRELSTVDVARVVTSTLAEVEVFVHGALCISWSGQCFSSEAWGGRSANRGQCAQACRLPYSLVVNGEERPDCDVSYLLSPQDLCGLDQVPALVEAGVSCLKIEGRLKDERYTAAVTRAYRNAVDEACGGGDPRVVAVKRQQLAQVFSRGQDGTHDGLSMGFLAGADHQRLVRGRSPRHRGVLAGNVVDAGVDDGHSRGACLWIVVEPRLADLKAGDGVVIDIDGARDDEIGGRLATVEQLDDASSLVLCTFEPSEHAKILRLRDFVAAGALLWRTSDPKVDAELGRLANPSVKLRPRRTEVRAALRTINASAAELWLSDGIRVAFATVPLARATSSDEHIIRSAFGELGNTPWRLAAFEIKLPGDRKAKAADVKAARRAAVAELARLRQPASRRVISSAASALPQIQEQRTACTTTHRAGISLLVRSLAQCKAAVAAVSAFKGCDFFDVDEIVLDFLEVTGLETALDLVRSSQATSVIAAPRILLPNEGKVIQRILELKPDSLLVRSTGLLHALREAPISKRGDFSLNAVNQIAASELLREGKLDRLTASYDLSANAVASLASRLPPGRFEAIVHSHLPIFHSSHCVFARHLSEGSDYTNCGHPCERHSLHLRHDGRDHLVLADMGCRNTVFNAAAQSGARDIATWLRAGLTRFRLEFVDESSDAVANIVEAYAELFRKRGHGPEPLWSLLAAMPRGVEVGSLRNQRERPAGRRGDRDNGSQRRRRKALKIRPGRRRKTLSERSNDKRGRCRRPCPQSS